MQQEIKGYFKMKNKRIITLAIFTAIVILISLIYFNNNDRNYNALKKELVIKDDTLKKEAINFSKRVVKTAQKNNVLSFSKKLKIDNQLGIILHRYANNIRSSDQIVAVNGSEKVKNYLYVYYKINDKFYKFQIAKTKKRWQLLNIVEVKKIS